MKKMVAWTLATSLILGSATNTFAQTNEANDENTKEIIVYFENKETMKQMEDELSDITLNIQYKELPVMVVEATAEEANELKSKDGVAFVEPNLPIYLNVEDNSIEPVESAKVSAVSFWGYEHIKAQESIEQGITGVGIKVAVADTGIELTHPDLRVSGGAAFITDTKENGGIDSTFTDYHGHGTHVAGTIAGLNNGLGVLGVAPDVSLYALKVFDKSGEGTTAQLLQAIDWSIVNDMDILNLSLGSQSGYPLFEKAIDDADKSGVLVVAAAGNDFAKPIGDGGCANDYKIDCVDYPAKYDSSVAVAAIDETVKHATFSSVGEAVDVAAPGVDIISTYIGGKYAYMSGTSMAAPHVSGVLALYKQKNPDATNKELKQLLQTTTVDIGEPGKDNVYGNGYVQIDLESKIPETEIIDEPETPEEPILPEIPTVPYNESIYLLSKTDLYNEAKENGEVISNLSPQSVYAFNRKGEWFEIRTWLGNKWIKPTSFLEGKTSTVTKRINITNSLTLYDLPSNTEQRGESLSNQKIYSKLEWNGWYLIETWIGEKWIKPNSSNVDGYIEVIQLKESVNLHTEPSEGYKTAASVSPQNVYAFEKRNGWYKIRTWVGDKWIKPTKYSVKKPEVVNQLLEIKTVVNLHSLPYVITPETVSPQSVFAIEKLENWYFIRTWIGNKWVLVE